MAGVSVSSQGEKVKVALVKYPISPSLGTDPPAREGELYNNPWPSWRSPNVSFSNGMKMVKMVAGMPSRPSSSDSAAWFPIKQHTLAAPPPATQDGVEYTWVGHASAVIRIGGFTVLTDPLWHDTCAPKFVPGNRRYVAPSVPLDQLPAVHACVISHDHYDHLSEYTVKKLDAAHAPLWFVPLGNEKHLASFGVPMERVYPLSWWEGARVPASILTLRPPGPTSTTIAATATAAGEKSNPASSVVYSPTSSWAPPAGSRTLAAGLEFVCTPTQHWSKRVFSGTRVTLWSSWVIRTVDEVEALTPAGAVGADGAVVVPTDPPAAREGGAGELSHPLRPVTGAAGCVSKAGVGGAAVYFGGDTGYTRNYELKEGVVRPGVLVDGQPLKTAKGAVVSDTDVLLPAALQDAGLGRIFTAAGDLFGPFDLAMLPIGAYIPRDFLIPQHMSPAEAVAAHIKLRAAHSVGIHWGTFILTCEPVTQPKEELEALTAAVDIGQGSFTAPLHGETLVYKRGVARPLKVAGEV